mmetsp:Transcript_23988/g.68723  ORF Transcript_23988/g.68723 Transcript_23988/m.68723 type:complete len:606 (+) Transcript_23988:77-1894(+)
MATQEPWPRVVYRAPRPKWSSKCLRSRRCEPACLHSASAHQLAASTVRNPADELDVLRARIAELESKCRCAWSPLPKDADYRKIAGISRTRNGGFKASIMMQSFRIDTWGVPELWHAWANRVAMKRVHRRVCEWLAEDRPPEDQVTDFEFAAFVRGVIEEVRATSQDLVPWRYFTDIPPERFRTTGCLADALRGWQQLRRKTCAESVFNMGECLKAHRDDAEALARQTMSSLGEHDYPTDVDVLQVLRRWGFSRNRRRANVLPEGRDWVASDTLGLVIPLIGSQKPVISKATRNHETVFRLLHRWVQGRLPEGLSDEVFPCTSMSVNKGYAAKLHRDARNAAPSAAIAVGDFKGGRLRYWPCDDGHIELSTLRTRRHLLLDTRAVPVVFDGNLGHEVESFTGERFSVILFTCPRREKASVATRHCVRKLGISMPTNAALDRLRAYLPGSSAGPCSSSGSGGGSSSSTRKKPQPASKDVHRGRKAGLSVARRLALRKTAMRLRGKQDAGGNRKRKCQEIDAAATRRFPSAREKRKRELLTQKLHSICRRSGSKKRTRPWLDAVAVAAVYFPGKKTSQERKLLAKRIYGRCRRKGETAENAALTCRF